jgi:hypothetical protein
MDYFPDRSAKSMRIFANGAGLRPALGIKNKRWEDPGEETQ